MCTEAVCMRSVLPTCCWLVCQLAQKAWKISSPLRRDPGITIPMTSTNYCCYEQNSSAGASRVMVHFFEIHHTRVSRETSYFGVHGGRKKGIFFPFCWARSLKYLPQEKSLILNNHCMRFLWYPE